MPYHWIILLVCCCAGAPVPGQAQDGRALSIAQIQQLPDTTLRLAFHFVALPDGTNFVTDPGDSLLLAHDGHEKLRADVLMYYLLRELNLRFRQALLDFPGSRDTKIRFSYARGPDRPLESAYFYDYGARIHPVADAFNVVFTSGRGSRRPDAATPGTGSRTIYIYDRLPTYLAGSHDTWTVARLIGHELGHALSLDHTFKCDNPCAGRGFDPSEECFGECSSHNAGSGPVNCFGGSPRDLLMGYGSQLYLTICEVERLWNYLYRHL